MLVNEILLKKRKGKCIKVLTGNINHCHYSNCDNYSFTYGINMNQLLQVQNIKNTFYIINYQHTIYINNRKIISHQTLIRRH